MKQSLYLPLLAALLLLAGLHPVSLHAEVARKPAAMTMADLRDHFPQPYVVKKGDTLWDIANHFFKDPWKWVKIWEQNLYITNPDLIYPGNKIWFDGQKLRIGGLTSERPHPQVVIKPVQRLEHPQDSDALRVARQRHGFLSPQEIDGVGYVLDSRDDRLNYGLHDPVYIKLQQPAKPGARFDVYRSIEPLEHPITHAPLGIMTQHLGTIRIDSMRHGIYRGTVVRAFEEISRGDRLMPAKPVAPDFHVRNAPAQLLGNVIYIRHHAHEAGAHQLIAISLGLADGLKPGHRLAIFLAGRVINDVVADHATRLPDEQIGDIVVLKAQQHAALAIITESTAPIHIGDTVRSPEQH